MYHELVHAYHKTKGDEASGAVPEKDAVHDYDTGAGLSAAEYQAVGLGPWAQGGKYETRGFNTHNGKPWGTGEFTENKYRMERNNITEGARYDDVELPEQLKHMYPNWQDWWRDGSMKLRPQYNPEPQVRPE